MLVFALVGLGGCDCESHAVWDVNPVRVAEMQQSLRNLWLGHIYWVQYALLNHATNSLAERHAAEKEVVANVQQIANTVTPFYGEARSEQPFTLLTGHYAAVKEYAEATGAGHTGQRDGRWPAWRLMSTTSSYSSTASIPPTYRKTPFGA